MNYFLKIYKILNFIIYGRFDNFLKEVNGLIHIGANTGQERDHYKKFNLKKVLWVEADPLVYLQLKDNIKSYKGQVAYNYLLTDKINQKYHFNIANNNSASSSIFEFFDHKKMYPHVNFIKKINLYSSTFSRMIKKEHVNIRDFNALILDTQGSELLILKGASNLLKYFTYIKVEAADFKLYKNSCLLNEISNYLKKYNFKEIKRIQIDQNKQFGIIFDVLYSKL